MQRRSLFVGITSLLVLGVAALVYAAWTSTGSGSGYAKAGSAQSLATVNASASTSATLYPGADGDVLIEIDNPNSYPVRVTSVTGSGTIAADAAHETCGEDGSHPTGVTFTDQTGLTIDVAAESSGQKTLANSVHMSNASDNSCQGATFTIPVNLSGASNAP